MRKLFMIAVTVAGCAIGIFTGEAEATQKATGAKAAHSSTAKAKAETGKLPDILGGFGKSFVQSVRPEGKQKINGVDVDITKGVLTVLAKGDVHIPEEFLKDRPDVTSVKFAPGSTPTKIGKRAFKGDSELDAKVEKRAFKGESKLQEIHIPASVEILEDSCFWKCKNLRKVEFEKGSRLKIIDDRGFQDCKKLEDIALEHLSHLEEIRIFAFSHSGLRHITIPKSVKTIDRQSFFNDNLETVIFQPESCLQKGDCSSNAGGYFSHCPAVKRMEIDKDTYERVGGQWAFGRVDRKYIFIRGHGFVEPIIRQNNKMVWEE